MERSDKFQVLMAAAMLSKEPSQLEQSVKEVLRVLRDKEIWAAARRVKKGGGLQD